MNETRVDEELAVVAELLARGMSDRSVAVSLGVSHRTVQRRISWLMRVLCAQTRFQAGYQFALMHLGREGSTGARSETGGQA